MANLQQFLEKTSRTFALAIPLLPEPTRTDVTLAYLLFRIVDTLEDAENLQPRERVQALEEIEALFESPNRARATALANKWSSQRPTTHGWYHELLTNLPMVLEELACRESPIQRLVFQNARRTAQGMAHFLQQDRSRLRSLAELQRYCYFVAGVVGEMLTEIFAERIAALSVTSELRISAQAFGEGLQLVNILKDADDDARHGRLFLPADSGRRVVFDLARDDLRQAEIYVNRLKDADAPNGYIAFTQLPLELAWATLERVERDGPGSKVPRDELARILAETHDHPETRSLSAQLVEENTSELPSGVSAS